MSLEKYTTRWHPHEDPERQILEETEQELHELQVDWQTFLIDAQVSESEVMRTLKNDEIRAAFRLKPKESIETQRVGLAELEKSLASLALLLPVSARESTHSLSELLAHFPPEKVASFSPNLKVMMWKIRTLVRDPSSPMTGYLESQWDRTISRVPVSSEMHRGIEDMQASVQEWRRPEEGNSIMNMVKNHWWKFLLVGSAGYAVHTVFSLFWAWKKEKAKVWFFERFVNMIPWGKYTLGTTIALWGIYALFGWKIREWLPDEETLQALSDFIEKPSLTWFLSILSIIFGQKKKKSESSKNLWPENVSLPSLPESSEARETVAETVGAARMYESYYWVFRPLTSMTFLERNIFKWQANPISLPSDVSYAQSKAKLPELEKRYTFLSDPPESHFTSLENQFRDEFHAWNGRHPLFWDIEEAIRGLTPEEKTLAGIVDGMPVEARERQFFRYLAVKITNRELTNLGYHIEAVHAWQLQGAKAYNALMDVKKNPDLFMEKLQNIEDARVAHINGIRWVDHLKREKIEAFLKLRETFQNTIAEKNTRVDTLVTDIRETMKREWYTLPDKKGTPITAEQLAKNQSLDQRFRPKLVEIAKIEWEVWQMATRFMKENESEIVRHLKTDGTGRILRYTMLQWLWKAPEYAQITDFHTGPRQQWFRLSSLRGWVIVTGIGAGFALMNAPMGEKIDTALAVSGRIVGWMVPLLAEYLDANDAYESFKKWEVWNGIIYSWALAMDAASTVLLATWIFSWAWVGMKGAKSALIREAIKSGTVKTAEIEWKNLVMRGVNGEIIGKPVLLESDEIFSIKKMTDWIDMSRSASVKTLAQYWLIAGMAVSLGGTWAMIAGGFLGNDGKMDAKSFTPDIHE